MNITSRNSLDNHEVKFSVIQPPLLLHDLIPPRPTLPRLNKFTDVCNFHFIVTLSIHLYVHVNTATRTKLWVVGYACNCASDCLLERHRSQAWFTPDDVGPITRITAKEEKLPRLACDFVWTVGLRAKRASSGLAWRTHDDCGDTTLYVYRAWRNIVFIIYFVFRSLFRCFLRIYFLMTKTTFVWIWRCMHRAWSYNLNINQQDAQN